MRPDYKNWMPKGMILSFAAGGAVSGLFCLLFVCTGFLAGGALKTVLIVLFAALTLIFCGLTIWSTI